MAHRLKTGEKHIVSEIPGAGSAGLEPYRRELMTFGYTLLPPELACPDALHVRLLDAVLARAGRTQTDLASSERCAYPESPMGQQLYYLLAADPVFAEAVMNPVLLELARYLIPDLLVSGVSANLKGPGELDMSLHADQPIHPCPRSLMCSAAYFLTPTSRAHGGTCFVPFSHHQMRQPEGAETNTETMRGLVSIEAPAGSLAIWHGNTWHGAHRRAEPGLRAQLLIQWCSRWIRPQEAYREFLAEEVIEREGDAFAELIGASVYFGWIERGPERARRAAFNSIRRRIHHKKEPT